LSLVVVVSSSVALLVSAFGVWGCFGFTLQRLWANSESAIAQKTSPSYEVKDSDIRRAVTALAAVPAATLPDSAFLSALEPQPPEWSHHKLDH